MKELTEEEREELLACEFTVKWDDYDGPKETLGKLVDIDVDIGITIINRDDPEDFLRCLAGPGANVGQTGGWEAHPGLYEEIFKGIINEIKEGFMDLTSNEITDRYNVNPGSNPGPDSCAFNR